MPTTFDETLDIASIRISGGALTSTRVQDHQIARPRVVARVGRPTEPWLVWEDHQMSPASFRIAGWGASSCSVSNLLPGTGFHAIASTAIGFALTVDSNPLESAGDHRRHDVQHSRDPAVDLRSPSSRSATPSSPDNGAALMLVTWIYSEDAPRFYLFDRSNLTMTNGPVHLKNRQMAPRMLDAARWAIAGASCTATAKDRCRDQLEYLVPAGELRPRRVQ